MPDSVATAPWSDGVRRALAWHETDPERRAIDHAVNHRWDTVIAAYQQALASAYAASEQ